MYLIAVTGSTRRLLEGGAGKKVRNLPRAYQVDFSSFFFLYQSRLFFCNYCNLLLVVM